MDEKGVQARRGEHTANHTRGKGYSVLAGEAGDGKMGWFWWGRAIGELGDEA